MYIRNLTERSIQTLKDTFVGILSGLPSSSPWLLWDKFPPQQYMGITRSSLPWNQGKLTLLLFEGKCFDNIALFY